MYSYMSVFFFFFLAFIEIILTCMFNHIYKTQCKAGVMTRSGTDAHRKKTLTVLMSWESATTAHNDTEPRTARSAHDSADTWAGINAAGSTQQSTEQQRSKHTVGLRITPGAAATLSHTVYYSHTATFLYLYLLGITQVKRITTRPANDFIMSKPLCSWSHCCSLKLSDEEWLNNT